VSRRSRSHPSTSSNEGIGLAGWLFADLFVGIAVIFLAASSVGGAPRRSVASPTTTTSPPTTTTVPKPVSLEREPIIVVVPDADAKPAEVLGAEVNGAITEQLNQRGIPGARVGFALVFGASPDTGDGIGIARDADNKLRQALPGLFGDAATRQYWTAELPRGSLRLELFFLN
jgi:hypothetical protein